MQIWAESGKSALPICNYSQILYQFLTFTQNLKRSPSHVSINRRCSTDKNPCRQISIHLMFLLIYVQRVAGLLSFLYFNTSHVSINQSALASLP